MIDAFAVAVLMPVHRGSRATQLREALTSIERQTCRPDEMLIIEDGPLSSAHTKALDDACSRMSWVRRVRLQHNAGVGPALQRGLMSTSLPWIARMDSDDVARPDRLAVQMGVLRECAYDVLGSAMAEFDADLEQPRGTRRLPECHAQIARMMAWANPVNHPTVVFRRQLAIEAGGYGDLPGLEDYDLWARMLAAGAIFHNLPEPLVLFRGGTEMLTRRRGLGMFRHEVRLQRNLHRYGVATPARAMANLVARTVFRALPPPLMALAYRRLFHEPSTGAVRDTSHGC